MSYLLYVQELLAHFLRSLLYELGQDFLDQNSMHIKKNNQKGGPSPLLKKMVGGGGSRVRTLAPISRFDLVC